MFDISFAIEILPTLLQGFIITLQATAWGSLLALGLGLGFALLRRSSWAWLSKPTSWMVEFIRSTPLLVQLYFLFYILPELGIQMSPLLTGVLALGLHYAAYTSEVYRAGIESIPPGMWEAGTALNFSKRQLYQKIILPQAIPPMIPALGNYIVAMFKETPLLSAITVIELLQQAKLIGSETFRYLEPMTLVGLLFLVISVVVAQIIGQLERHLARS